MIDSADSLGLPGRGLGTDRMAAGRLRPLLLPAAIGLLLAIEVLAVSVRFNVVRVVELVGLDQYLLLTPRAIIRALVVAVATTLLLGGRRLAAGLIDRDRPGPRAAEVGFYLIGHAVAFAAFVGLTIAVGAGDRSPGRVAAWAAAGSTALVLAISVGLPPSRWWPMVRCAPGAIALGMAIGIASMGAGPAATRLWLPLADATLRVVAALLGLVSSEVECTPSELVVGLADFRAHIAPECSGYEGIGMVLALLTGFLWYDRSSLRFPRAFLLLPIGVALIWVCNAVRIALLIMIGAWVSPEIAIDGFHSQAGSIGFVVVSLGLVALGRLRTFRRLAPDRTASDEAGGSVNPATAYLVPFLAIVGASMVSAAFSPGDGFDRGYPLRVVAAGLVFWRFRGRYGPVAWSWSPWAVGSGVLVFFLWMAMEPTPTGTSGPPAGLMRLPTVWAAAWLACRLIGSVVAVPMAEELAFRGYLARRFQSAEFESVDPRWIGWASIIVTSVLFGALHGRWLAGCLAGLIYACTYRRRGSIGDAIVAHAVTNALIAAFVLATGSWTLWS